MTERVMADRNRLQLHRVAAHVLARRRHQVTGRIGLRSSPGGIATPPFGPDREVVRISGDLLVREAGSGAAVHPVPGATLRQLCRLVGADPEADFSGGGDTPPAGDLDAPVELDRAGVLDLAAWWSFGWTVLDAVVGGLPGVAATTTQLWPEHFDAGTTLTIGTTGANLGFSPGDGWCDEPYAYVGPTGPDRPGPGGLWNAPFGAALRRSELGDGPAEQVCLQWFAHRLAPLGATMTTGRGADDG